MMPDTTNFNGINSQLYSLLYFTFFHYYSFINSILLSLHHSFATSHKEWQDKGLPKIIVSVNISCMQLKQRDFVINIIDILEETGLEPRFLELEITESIMIADRKDVIRELRHLKEIGVNICLDDFGTGYSSLNYLSILPLQTLNMDSQCDLTNILKVNH